MTKYLKQSDVSETAIALEFLKAGFLVSEPISQRSKYDLVVDSNGEFYRVQCKSAKKHKKKKKTIISEIRATGYENGIKAVPYDEDDFDLLCIYYDKKDEVYLFKDSEYGKSKVLLTWRSGEELCEHNRQKLNFTEDFLIENRIEEI